MTAVPLAICAVTCQVYVRPRVSGTVASHSVVLLEPAAATLPLRSATVTS
jgi:hypothetical protein